MTDPNTQQNSPSSGIALPTVLVMLLLSSLLTLAAWRSIWLNERLWQGRADALRTVWIADASLHAALDDVLQRGPLASENDGNGQSQRHDMGSDEQQHVFFPKHVEQLAVLRQRLGNRACHEGICAPDQPLPPASSDTVTVYWQSQATSGMPVKPQSSLQPTGDARYWIEIFSNTGASDTPTLVYRITAMAARMKSAKPVLVQAIWIPNEDASPHTNNAHKGQWVSWTQLHD